MRRLLLALPFALLPLTIAQANEHEHGHAHESLSAHEHGAASLNAVLEGQRLELQLESPAMNLVGFEHAARSDADKAKVAAAKAELEQPVTLFALAAGDCKATQVELESPLFEEHDHDQAHEDAGEHSEIHAHYQLHCERPDALRQLNLGELFKHFAAFEKIQVQLIGPSGQRGGNLTPSAPSLSF